MRKKPTQLERLGIKPLRFRGKMISVEIPYFPPSQPAPENPEPIARINFHIDTCRVLKVVRITSDARLSEEGLDNPEYEPWFFMMGAFRGILRYFIVNGEDCYLPILTGHHGEPDDPETYSLMNPSAYKEELKITHANGDTATFIYDWDMFSRLDLGLVREAIATYTRGVY